MVKTRHIKTAIRNIYKTRLGTFYFKLVRNKKHTQYSGFSTLEEANKKKCELDDLLRRETEAHNYSANIGRGILVSPEMQHLLRDRLYNIGGNGYPQTCIRYKLTYLHHRILPAKKGITVDHVNNNKLDNRIENLRYATYAQNNTNKKAKGFKRSGNGWTAYIQVNGTPIYLGYFANEQDAIRVRREAEIKYFGEFAPIRIGT